MCTDHESIGYLLTAMNHRAKDRPEFCDVDFSGQSTPRWVQDPSLSWFLGQNPNPPPTGGKGKMFSFDDNKVETNEMQASRLLKLACLSAHTGCKGGLIANKERNLALTRAGLITTGHRHQTNRLYKQR